METNELTQDMMDFLSQSQLDEDRGLLPKGYTDRIKQRMGL